MNFVSRHYIVLNAIVVTLLVISFIRMRRATRQNLMKLKNPHAGKKEVIIKKMRLEEGDPRMVKPSGPKSLNAVFNYNGHSWDAYEVLGVAAGSGFETSFLAFEKLTKDMDSDSKSFMLSALEAIRLQHIHD